MIQSITSAIHLVLNSGRADFPVRGGTHQITTAPRATGASAQYAPPTQPLTAVHKTIEVVQAAVHIAPLMHPIGFLASAFTGPRIETTNARSFSVPQLLANATVNAAEKTYSHFTRDPAYMQPEHIASWGELAQRIAPSKESLLDGALLVLGTAASKGKNPGMLGRAKNGKAATTKSLKSVREEIGKVQAQLKDKQTLLEQTKVQRAVFESGPAADAAEFTRYNSWVTTLENEVAKLTSQLGRLNKQQEKLLKP